MFSVMIVQQFTLLLLTQICFAQELYEEFLGHDNNLDQRFGLETNNDIYFKKYLKLEEENKILSRKERKVIFNNSSSSTKSNVSFRNASHVNNSLSNSIQSSPSSSIVSASSSSSSSSSSSTSTTTSKSPPISKSTQASPLGSSTSSTTSTTSSPSSSKKPQTNITSSTAPIEPVLPDKHALEDEHNNSMSIFFVLCVLALGILLIHLMLQTNFQYLPESVVIVLLGALIGLILNLMSNQNIANWKKEEAFSPNAFFLILLPPIIFESGYNLHKGNFFQNIGSILVFAIFGTAISAFIIGAGIYLLGLAKVAYKLSFVESFAFGSLISAVDPVATVAIFHALDVDPVLNMLVFGESILNDAIAIVLTSSIFESSNPNMSSSEAILTGLNRFCLMFFASAAIGVSFSLVSALLLKHVNLRKNPSLEFGIMLVFTYAPYALAEGIRLSGIMAILFCGIGMSHYTHFNLSTVTQITMQQTMRTMAFIAETCVFAYLGLALFSFKHRVEPALVIWSIVLCLIGRACNIFPLAFLVNKFREHQITKKMMFIMWFSGLRGAISYALSLHLEFSDETRHVIITTTLIIVLFTTLIFGGSTMPLMKFLQAGRKTKSRRKRKEKEISLSKTREWGQTIDSEHLSQTEEELEVNFFQSRIKGFAKLDYKYFRPFFTRRFTQQELKDCKSQMTDLTNQWYQAIRVSPNESDNEELTSVDVKNSHQH
ncbi:sodium/hydrogen exchanger, putative [Pediculus humanus corporis]|uniref:Sodium/hydrogen exchanger n=1 Tax=Pediculus humanus subsp. corporis TaxID=121224 RepID=E0VLV5_PEDHC|nr:sodium/hydrogen exchanger, putative [Pediculus humanus corporis]EEB14361.1 sodium/hydrogen exchanger, putative [Pediculus humanus corporis]